MFSTFWRAVETISQPVLYRLNRLFFGDKVANFIKGVSLSLAFLAGVWIAGRLVIPHIARFLAGLPF
jgi:YggT family protein